MSTDSPRNATPGTPARAETFRQLHLSGPLLRLPNAWDAGSARILEACGARALATTSAGMAWAHGWPDGNALPRRVIATAVEEIVRAVSVPLTVDAEGGYSAKPEEVGETIAAIVGAGGVGVNLEDGAESVDLLCAKIEAARRAAVRAGVKLFVNARTDVFIKRLVPPERAVAETLARGARYRAAGADGFFVPYLVEPAAVREVVAGVALPLNLLVAPGLAPVAELETLGVRRVTAGSSLTAAAYAVAKRATAQFLDEGRYEAMLEARVDYAEMNRLFRG